MSTSNDCKHDDANPHHRGEPSEPSEASKRACLSTQHTTFHHHGKGRVTSPKTKGPPSSAIHRRKIQPLQKLVLRGLISRTAETQRQYDLMHAFFALQHTLTWAELERERAANLIKACARAHAARQTFVRQKYVATWVAKRYHDRKSRREHALEILKRHIVPYTQRRVLRSAVCDETLQFSPRCAQETLNHFFSKTTGELHRNQEPKMNGESKTTGESKTARDPHVSKTSTTTVASKCLSKLGNHALATLLCGEMVCAAKATATMHAAQPDVEDVIWSLCTSIPSGIPRVGHTLVTLLLALDAPLSFATQTNRKTLTEQMRENACFAIRASCVHAKVRNISLGASAVNSLANLLNQVLKASTILKENHKARLSSSGTTIDGSAGTGETKDSTATTLVAGGEADAKATTGTGIISTPTKPTKPGKDEESKETASTVFHKYNVGDRIQCRFKKKGAFYPGHIAGLNEDGTYHVKYTDGDENDSIRDEIYHSKEKKYIRIKLIASALLETYKDVMSEKELQNAVAVLNSIPRRSSNDDKPLHLDERQVRHAIEVGMLISVRAQSEIKVGQDVVWQRGSDKDYHHEDGEFETGSFLATKVKEKNKEMSKSNDACHVPECNYVMVRHLSSSYLAKYGQLYRYATATPAFPQIPRRSQSGPMDVSNSAAELAIQCGLLELVESQEQVHDGDDVVWKRGTSTAHCQNGDRGEEKDIYLATTICQKTQQGWKLADCDKLFFNDDLHNETKALENGVVYRYSGQGNIRKLMAHCLVLPEHLHLKSVSLSFGKTDLHKEKEACAGAYEFFGLRQGVPKNKFAVPYYVKMETGMVLYQSPSTGKICIAKGTENMNQNKSILSTTQPTTFGKLLTMGTRARCTDVKWIATPPPTQTHFVDSPADGAQEHRLDYAGVVARIYHEHDSTKGPTFQRALLTKFKGIEDILLSTLFQKFKVPSAGIKRLKSGELAVICRAVQERDPKQVFITVTSSNTEATFASNDPLCGEYILKPQTDKYEGSKRKFVQQKPQVESQNTSSNLRNVIHMSSGKWHVYDESGNRRNSPHWRASSKRAVEAYCSMVPDGCEVTPSTRDALLKNFEARPPIFGWRDTNNDIDTTSPPFLFNYRERVVTHEHTLVLQKSKKGKWFCNGCTDRDGYQASEGSERWRCDEADFDLCKTCKLKSECYGNSTALEGEKDESEPKDLMGNAEEAEIENLFRHQKTAVELFDAKPILFSLRRSLAQLLEIVPPCSTATYGPLHYNLRCMATRLLPHNACDDLNTTSNDQMNALLSPWNKSVAVIVRAFRSSGLGIQTAKRTLSLLREFHVPALQSQEADLLSSEDVCHLRRMCVSGVFKRDDVRGEAKRLLQQRIPELRSRLLKETEALCQRRAEEIATSRNIKRLAFDLQLDDDATEEMGKLLAKEEKWVGAHNAKEFVRGYLDDIIGRIRLREDPVIRHILLQGNSGTGKAMAANFIARWMTLVNSRSSAGDDGPGTVTLGGKPPWLTVGRVVQLKAMSGDASSGPLKLGETGKITEVGTKNCKVRGWCYAFSNVGLPERQNSVIEISGFKTLETELEELTKGQTETYYIRLGGRAGGNVSKVLGTAAAKGCVVILGGTASACQSFASNNMYFLKQDPIVIDMPVLSTTELAKISLQRIASRGYRLSCSGMSGGSTPQGQLKAMIGIVAQKYSETEIIRRNAYLAADCVELAVSRKNRRLRDFELAQRLDAKETKTDDHDVISKSAPLPFLLEAVDFDVKTISLEERKRRQTTIDLKIAAMKGWGSEQEAGTPLHYFYTMRRILTKMQSTGETKDSEDNMRPWDFNLVVESGNGGGKCTFVTYVSEFLAAYGILESSNLVKRSAAELRAGKWDSEDDAKTKATGAFADAREQNGGLLVMNAESLAPSMMLAASGGAGSAPITSVTASVLATQVGSLPFVALACEEQTSRAVLSAHPDLSSKFPWIVRIEAPTDVLLAEIAQEYCENVRGVAFANGLMESLIEHIHETNDGSTGMRYARTLVDDALRRRAERRSAVHKHKGETKQDRVDTTQRRDDPCLIATDFEIGKEIGDVEAREKVYRELEGLIGMDKAKKWLCKIRRQIDLANKTKDRRGLKRCYNLVLTGKPGTGKTTFARLVHRFLKAHGVLTGEFVEKNALELKGEYVGSTTPMVKACFTEAKGGTLFLDEAYALASDSFKSGGDTFSKEAIRTLLTEVENNRTGTVVILAGYEDKMKGLMRADPGLPRRFPHSLQLENYTANQLASIAEYVAKGRFDRTFDHGLKEKLAKHILHKYRKDIEEQNGGLSVNLIESAVTNQEDRIMTEFETNGNDGVDVDVDDKTITERIQRAKMVLKAVDFGITDTPEMGTTEQEKQEVETELASLIGMDNVKRFFHKMRNQALFVQKTGKIEALGGCLHLVLTGNPGTGKTTTARLIARYLKAFGILPTGQFHEVNGLHLKGQYVGQTSHRVSNIVKDALGGCLFIDEAYSLASNGGDAYGKEVIRTLLTEVENHRSDLLVILAGYRGPMAELMNADPGLRSRFNTRLHLKDYSSEEVARIAELTATRKTFHFEPGLIPKLSQQIATTYGKRRISQENGRMAVNLVERAIERMATRLITSGLGDAEIKALDSVLTKEDFNDQDEECFNDFEEEDSWGKDSGSSNYDCPSRPSTSTSTSTILGISMADSDHNSPVRHLFEPGEHFDDDDCGPRYRDPRIRELGGGGDKDSALRGDKIRNERIAPPKAKVQEDADEEEQFICVQYNGADVDILWSPGDDVFALKERIEVALGLEASQFKITRDGTTLKDEQTIEELVEDMEEDTALEVIAGLFAQMAGMSRVAFAVDLSGSMSSGVGKGQTQMSVVQDHLRRCIRSLNGEGCEIGIATFTSRAQLPLGPTMVNSRSRRDEILQAVDKMHASGGNGGEAACLRSLINMDPQCIFFLGDGGWEGQALIKEATVAASCGIQIHSIAFYLQGVGSGLPEIAKITGGTYRDVKNISEYSMA